MRIIIPLFILLIGCEEQPKVYRPEPIAERISFGEKVLGRCDRHEDYKPCIFQPRSTQYGDLISELSVLENEAISLEVLFENNKWIPANHNPNNYIFFTIKKSDSKGLACAGCEVTIISSPIYLDLTKERAKIIFRPEQLKVDQKFYISLQVRSYDTATSRTVDSWRLKVVGAPPIDILDMSGTGEGETGF